MLEDSTTVEISIDSMEEIGKTMLLRTYHDVVSYQHMYEEKGVDNLSSYELDDYEYNKPLLEAMKVVIRYVTMEAERPEGV